MNMIIEVDKSKIKQTVVVYAGRFQPFHPGHYAVYKHLVDKFGKDSVYIGSSDDTSGPKSPLRFKEKKLIAVNIFGVPSSRFVKVQNPYQPVEILKKYNGKTTQYIAALGEKDSDRLSGKYFKPYKGKAGYGYDEIGYTYNVPSQAGGISATEVRKGISNKDKNKAKDFFKKVYPKYDAEIFNLIRNTLLKENYKSIMTEIDNSKTQSITHFVEWATKRLKLSEKPNVDLVGGTKISENQSSLGGYNTDTKSIFVQTENRLSADIIRTIAHEMVHRKQDEMGLIKNPSEDGKTGSPIENQANAIAGILMREYGKINKKIYTESKKIKNEAIIDDKFDSVIGDIKDKISKKYKSLQSVKYDTHDKTYTFIFSDEKDANNFRIDFEGTKSQKVQFDKIDYEPKQEPKLFYVKFKTQFREVDEHYVPSTGMFNRNLTIQQKIDKLNPSRAKQKAKIWHKTFSHHNPDTGETESEKLNREDITLPVNVGDTVLMGKFKNKKVKVKNIGKDDHNMPTINGRIATTFRTDKKEINEVSILTGTDAQPDGAFLPKGKTRILGKGDSINKKDNWFIAGGYTQTDFPTADPIFGDDDAEYVSIKYTHTNVPRTEKSLQTDFELYTGETLEELFNNWASDYFGENYKKSLLSEGGAAGHMAHPFEDMKLTFGDLKNIITGALNGELGVVKEKLDGQALAISWKNGRLIAARNKSHIKNAGINAMGIEDVASKFANRGGLTDAYNFAMKDLSAAISGLSQKQKEKIFNEGRCFMNIEVIWPESVNVIPYGQAMLVFHNTTCYDDDANAIGADASAARMLAGMIKQINADVQSKYSIAGPAITEIPKKQELVSKQSQYLSKLKKLQNEFGSKEDDTMGRYHEMWWENFIDEKAPVSVDKLTKQALVRRWAFGDKSFRLNTISNEKLRDWAMKNDKVNVEKKQKENMKKFEEIFLGVGAEVLQFVSSAVTVNPNDAIRSMKDELKSIADEVKNASDPKKIEKFKQELKRLKSLGGHEKIVPIEGIVFEYKGKVYKLTGTFAPLNQLLGIFYS